jgi:uncharacterized protein YkwD
MALRGFVGHDSSSGASFLDRLGSAVPAGTRVGENVVAIQTVEQANSAFSASEGHLRNMLDPAFRIAGIGIVDVGRMMMITEDFAE